MPSEPKRDTAILPVDGEEPGATASFPFDRMTVERFREAFPRARWREDLRAWFVPGKTADRRLNRWLGREMSGVLAYADDRGKDAHAFDPIVSPYLHIADDLLVATPFSRTIVDEMRNIPWAAWDEEMRVWRIPFRSYEELRRRWPTIEAAAQRNEPSERRRRQEERRRSAVDREEERARAAERRRRRFPVALSAMPPLGRPVMTALGAIVFTAVDDECVDPLIASRFYPDVGDAASDRVWASWRRPSQPDLVGTWPARVPPTAEEKGRGWWQPTLAELREHRRKARSMERRAMRRKSPAP